MQQHKYTMFATFRYIVMGLNTLYTWHVKPKIIHIQQHQTITETTITFGGSNNESCGKPLLQQQVNL